MTAINQYSIGDIVKFKIIYPEIKTVFSQGSLAIFTLEEPLAASATQYNDLGYITITNNFLKNVGNIFGTNSILYRGVQIMMNQTQTGLLLSNSKLYICKLSGTTGTRASFTLPELTTEKLTALQAITDGKIDITIDDGTTQKITGLNFSKINTSDVEKGTKSIINIFAKQGLEMDVGINDTKQIVFVSKTTGNEGSVVLSTGTASEGTDISELLNIAEATTTAGVDQTGPLDEAEAITYFRRNGCWFGFCTTTRNIDNELLVKMYQTLNSIDMNFPCAFIYNISSTTTAKYLKANGIDKYDGWHVILVSSGLNAEEGINLRFAFAGFVTGKDASKGIRVKDCESQTLKGIDMSSSSMSADVVETMNENGVTCFVPISEGGCQIVGNSVTGLPSPTMIVNQINLQNKLQEKLNQYKKDVGPRKKDENMQNVVKFVKNFIMNFANADIFAEWTDDDAPVDIEGFDKMKDDLKKYGFGVYIPPVSTFEGNEVPVYYVIKYGNFVRSFMNTMSLSIS